MRDMDVKLLGAIADILPAETRNVEVNNESNDSEVEQVETRSVTRRTKK